MYTRNPNDKPTMPCVKAPALYNSFGPILAPYLPNMGANRNAARLAMPKTKPYCDGVAPFFAASLG